MKNSDNNEMANAAIKQVIKQITNAWQAQNKTLLDIFSKYPDSTYLQEIAPGRNRAIYLLGHLTAFNDGLLPMLGLGDKLFPQLEKIFITSSDKSVQDIPTVAELKEFLNATIKKLTEHFEQMTTEDWLSGHTKVSEEDFKKDPLRNKLNVLIGRTVHHGYHIGQLGLLKGEAV